MWVCSQAHPNTGSCILWVLLLFRKWSLIQPPQKWGKSELTCSAPSFLPSMLTTKLLIVAHPLLVCSLDLNSRCSSVFKHEWFGCSWHDYCLLLDMQCMILISITISTCNRLSLESVIYSIFNITGFSRIIIKVMPCWKVLRCWNRKN